nr:hypothetical protein [uncultured Noviherbaspirillum sp.]
MIEPVVSPTSLSSRFISSLSAPQPQHRLNHQTLQSVDTDAQRDVPFNGYRIPCSCQARELVHDILSAIQSHESRLGIRKRARKSFDQQTFERQVEALVCDLAFREFAAPRAWTSIPFSKVVLGRRDRYRSKVVNESIPSVVRMMAASGLELLEYQVGYRNPFDFTAGRRTVIRASQTLHKLIAERQLTKADFGLAKTEEVIILKASKEAHWDKGEWV